MLLSKLTNRSLYDILQVIGVKYYKFKTQYWVGIFLNSNGGQNCIIKPILLTPKCISLGKNILVRNGGRIEGVKKYERLVYNPSIIIKNNVSIEQNVHITCASKIEIGQNTAIAANVTISDIDHPYTNINLPPEKQQIKVTPVEIGENCKIYNNVVILPGARLGKHNIVAANAVVLGNQYPDYIVLAGCPAKIIKRYNVESKCWEKTKPNGEFVN